MFNDQSTKIVAPAARSPGVGTPSVSWVAAASASAARTRLVATDAQSRRSGTNPPRQPHSMARSRSSVDARAIVKTSSSAAAPTSAIRVCSPASKARATTASAATAAAAAGAVRKSGRISYRRTDATNARGPLIFAAAETAKIRPRVRRISVAAATAQQVLVKTRMPHRHGV